MRGSIVLLIERRTKIAFKTRNESNAEILLKPHENGWEGGILLPPLPFFL